VGVLLLLGVFFLPSVAPASQQDFFFYSYVHTMFRCGGYTRDQK
jgi:hypothetical protein